MEKVANITMTLGRIRSKGHFEPEHPSQEFHDLSARSKPQPEAASKVVEPHPLPVLTGILKC